MKKILIIGSDSTLGRELARTFGADEGYAVTSWTSQEADPSEEKRLEEKIGALAPDAILNAVSYDEIDKCEADKAEYAKAKAVNGEWPGRLAGIAEKLGAVLVHYSTDYVFNGEPEIPEPEGCSHSCATCALHEGFVPEIGFQEDDAPDPISDYGRSKLLGEKSVAKNSKRYYVIRFSKLFGRPGEARETRAGFFDRLLAEAEEKSEVEAIDEEVSGFTYAPDLARKTKEIIESEKPFGIYHVSNGTPTTWYEAAVELYRQAGIKAKVTLVFSSETERIARRPFYSALISTKLNPLRDWKEALKDYLSERNQPIA